MQRLLWVCLGGAIGSGLRYLIAIWAGQRIGGTLPYGTLIVNLFGCFLISVILQAATLTTLSPTLRTALAVGFVGGLTTYSSFNYETTRLLQDGQVGTASVNVLLTAVGGFAAGWLGLILSRRLLG